MAAPISERGAGRLLEFELGLGDVVGSKYRDHGGIHEWSPDERLERGPGLHVPQALLKDHLFTLYRREKVRQLSGGDAKLLIVSLLSAAQLGACQLDLAFRPTRESSVVFGDAAHPAFPDEGIRKERVSYCTSSS